MKYTKYGIAFGLLMVVTGVIITLLVGYHPAPTPIMRPSFFDKADEIGAVTLKHFYAPLATENIVVLGVPSNRDWSTQVVSGFLQAASAHARSFTHVVIEQHLQKAMREEVKRLVPTAVEMDTNSEELTELTEAVLNAQKAGHRLLVIVPNLYSTHLLLGNVMQRLESNIAAGVGAPRADARSDGRSDADRVPRARQDIGGKTLFAITVSPLALEAAQEKELDPVCIGSERDGSGTADLGCAILQAGRSFYRKRILEKEPRARDRFIAIMQSTKPGDYMLMIREPQNFGKNL